LIFKDIPSPGKWTFKDFQESVQRLF